MKIAIIIIILALFMREVFRMFLAIETGAKPIKMIVPCVSACVIAVLAKFVGNLLTMV